MAHFLVSRLSPSEFQSFRGYRFGRHDKSAGSSLHRFGGVLRRSAEAIAESKIRRMERELELLGIRTREPDNFIRSITCGN